MSHNKILLKGSRAIIPPNYQNANLIYLFFSRVFFMRMRIFIFTTKQTTFSFPPNLMASWQRQIDNGIQVLIKTNKFSLSTNSVGKNIKEFINYIEKD